MSPDRTPKAATGTAAFAARVVPVLDTVRNRILPRYKPLFHYLLRTETHTYAFSVAANAILSFYPFVLLMMTLLRRFFHSWGLDKLLLDILQATLPAGQNLVANNLDKMVSLKATVTLWSIAVLLFTSTGVFLPLEVALNEVWGVKKGRSYVMNQVVSFGLAFAVGVLGMISVTLSALGILAARLLFFPVANTEIFGKALHIVLGFVAVPASILIFFLIYWLLPNCKVPWRSVMPSAIATGVLWEIAKIIYVLCLPKLNFRESYGPFAVSVTLIMWAFISGLIMLAGARSCVLGRIEEPAECQPAAPAATNSAAAANSAS